MSDNLIRVYQKQDVNAIKPHLLIYGDLGGSCASCNKIDIKLESKNCPGCQTEFKYISFRNVRVHVPKILKLLEQNPALMIIDYEDYSRNIGAMKAHDFLK